VVDASDRLSLKQQNGDSRDGPMRTTSRTEQRGTLQCGPRGVTDAIARRWSETSPDDRAVTHRLSTLCTGGQSEQGGPSTITFVSVIEIQDCKMTPGGTIRPSVAVCDRDHCCAAHQLKGCLFWTRHTQSDPRVRSPTGRLPGRSACPPYAGVVSLQSSVNSRPGLITVRLSTVD